MSEKVDPALLCSVESLESGESLVGTAPRGNVWFALEYTDRWGKKAFEESSLSDEIKRQVNAQLKLIPESKLLLINQRPRSDGQVTFFAALPTADPPVLYRFTLSDYEDLLSLSLVSIANQEYRYAAAVSQEPVFFVCTNGLRDQCCALHGTGTYAALAEQFGDLVWQSTHHGGHRFAANLLALPAGLSFGRMRPENAVSVVRKALAGRIDLDQIRGRITYEEPAQAGEILLRKELELDGFDTLKLIESQPAGSGRWQLRFADSDGAVHQVVLERSEGPEQIHLSCGDEKTSPMVHFRLVEHSKL